MTADEEEHLRRMLEHAKQHAKILAKQRQLALLTPQELADALIALKKKFPSHFPTSPK